MTDTQHSQEKEALEDAANRLLTYPGIGQVATLAYTETTDWITHDDGSVTGTNYGNGVKWSANALAAFAMWNAAQQPAPPVSPPPPPPPPVSPPPPPVSPPPPPPPATGFLYKYALEVITPAYQATVPALGASWPCPESGATITRITDWTKLAAAIPKASGAVVDYSRFPPENADASLLLVHIVSDDGSVYSFRMPPSDQTKAVQNKGVGGDPIGEVNELRWDGADPDTFYFVDGMTFCSKQCSADKAQVIRDFSKDFPKSTQIYTDVEGSCSLDSRYWCWMAVHYDSAIGYFVVDDIFTFDKQANAILGKYTAHATLPPAANGASKPNMVDVCPDGSGCLIDWGPKQGSAPDQDGAHFYPLTLDVSQSVKVAHGEEHSGWAMNAAGAWGFVSADNSTDNLIWCSTTGGYNGPDRVVINNMANFGYAEDGDWHFGRMTTKGFVALFAAHTADKQPGDNQVLYFPIAPNATPLLVTATFNIETGNYYDQCFGATSLDGTRLYWGANYGGKIKGQDVFMTTIPADWATHVG